MESRHYSSASMTLSRLQLQPSHSTWCKDSGRVWKTFTGLAVSWVIQKSNKVPTNTQQESERCFRHA
ncbi:MAG: hypothetical protein CMM07_00095, partial [Rhodopirellula sp.]|nr:hypothetical protein [Rhodopirellula sp.]